LEFEQDVDVDWLSRVLATEPPDEIALASLMASGGEGGRDSGRRGQIEEVDPSLTEDLVEEIAQHADMGEEKMIAGVVLSQELLSSWARISSSGRFAKRKDRLLVPEPRR
jgi:hypothetical protein